MKKNWDYLIISSKLTEHYFLRVQKKKKKRYNPKKEAPKSKTKA